VLYETITARLPDATETKAFLNLLEDLEKKYTAEPDLTDGLCEGVTLPEGSSASELSAWTVLVSTIYNLDITKTRE
jgi:hypothetical protein